MAYSPTGADRILKPDFCGILRKCFQTFRQKAEFQLDSNGKLAGG
jgi:hypothetical protein